MTFPAFPPGHAMPAFAWEGLNSDAGQWGMLLALAAFSAIWITALGAAVGSFLNVVVWRLPLGMSLVRPKSHCPKCGTPILARDNLPVIGWLGLRGKCRACGTSISSRYPLVEATMALLFLGLAHFELFSGGANLPGGPPAPTGLTAVLWHLRPEVIGVFAYHATLLALLLCHTLIAWDGFRPPRGLVAFGVAFGLLLPMLLPVAHPIKSGVTSVGWPRWKVPTELVSITVAPLELIEGACGLLGGAIVGAWLACAVPRRAGASADRWGTIAVGSLTGLFLGWQAVVACGLAASLLALVNAIATHVVARVLPVTGLLAITTLLHLWFWRTLGGIGWIPNVRGWDPLRRVGWPHQSFEITSLVAAAIAAGVVAVLAGAIRSRKHVTVAIDATSEPDV